MSSGIDCGKLDEVLDSIFQIPVNAEKLDKWVNGGEFETVILGGKEVPTLRNLVRQIDERSSQAAEEEINEAKAEIGALAEKLKAKIEELKALTASAETLPPDHPATAYYNSGTGEIEFGIPQGKQGIQGERGLAPAIDIIYGGDPSDEALSIIYGGNPALNEPGDRTIVRQVARMGTSAQWTLANPILEDGESGYERTPDDKLLWKIGDGVSHWNDLPYPSILIDKIYRFKGSVATVEDLPANAQEGDVYNITSTGANYAWTGTEWDNLGVAGAIDPAPIKGSGNPVASGGVYAALEDIQVDIAATGAPDDVTIVKNESGKLVAQDIAIGGDPADLASARGYIVDELLPWYPGYSEKPLADFDAVTILGRYHVMVHKETTLNAPPILLFSANTLSNDGMLIVEAMSSAIGISSVRRYRQTFMVFGSASKIWVRYQGTSGEWGTWREIIAGTNIGDGIRGTNGMLSVPEYEGATATEPGTAGLVNPAAPAEKDYVYHGDGTWRENTNVKVDGTTIAKDDSDVISVIPGGIIDNDTIVLNESGKLTSKNIPFDGGSIFACLAGNGEGSWTDEGQAGVNQQFRPNLSDASFQKSLDGKSFCHVENNAIVLDEDGFFIVRLRRAFYPGAENTGTFDLTESISHKGAGGSVFYNIGTNTVEINNDPDLWNYIDFSIVLHGKKGDSISSLTYGPIDARLQWYSGSYGLYVFKISATNGQINSSEINTYTKTSLQVPNPNSSPNIFDPGDLVTSSFEYSGRAFTKKTADGYIEMLESGMYIIVYGVGVVISSNDGNTYDMPHGMALVGDGAFKSLVSQSTVTVRSNDVTNDYDESTALIYLKKGDVIAPFIYAPTRIYNPIKVEYSNVRIVRLASASQITVATDTKLGVVKGGHETVKIAGDGTLSVPSASELISSIAGQVLIELNKVNIATTTTPGLVQPDGTSITVNSAGKISATGSSSEFAARVEQLERLFDVEIETMVPDGNSYITLSTSGALNMPIAGGTLKYKKYTASDNGFVSLSCDGCAKLAYETPGAFAVNSLVNEEWMNSYSGKLGGLCSVIIPVRKGINFFAYWNMYYTPTIILFKTKKVKLGDLIV